MNGEDRRGERGRRPKYSEFLLVGRCCPVPSRVLTRPRMSGRVAVFDTQRCDKQYRCCIRRLIRMDAVTEVLSFLLVERSETKNVKLA